MGIKPQVTFASIEEKDLYNFILKNLMSKSGGIYTNTVKKKAAGDLPAGDEILSESTGLFMQYALEADSQTLFEKQFLYLKEVYTVKDNLIVWKVDENNNKKSWSNSLIDDLRICSTLLSAYEKWEDKRYLDYALSISRGLQKHNMKKSILVDFYDYKTEKSGEALTISYIDTNALKKIYSYERDWAVTYMQLDKILQRSQFDGNDVFSNRYYSVLEGRYYCDKKINMVQQLLAAENLLRAGIKKVKTLQWLKAAYLRDGFIKNEYDPISMKSATLDESPAVYAIACRIFMEAGDFGLAKSLYEKMLMFRITDKNSAFFGGYADLKSGESYSYDNLQALITMRYIKNRTNSTK